MKNYDIIKKILGSVTALQNQLKEKRILIRNATKEDLPSIMYINSVALPENYPEYFFLYHLENWDKAFFVAEVEGKVVGYMMNRVETGLGFSKKFIVKKGHVVSIAVLEGYRRMGIGEALMRAGIDSLRRNYNVDEIYLEVRVSNEPAIKLYEKLGFKKIKILEGYYSDGESAYLMSLTF